MNEIICPNCKKAFKVDEAGFAAILKQVRDHQFEEEIQDRLALAEKDKKIAVTEAIRKIEKERDELVNDLKSKEAEKENAVKLLEAQLNQLLQTELTKKDHEIMELKAKNELELAERLSKKESEIAEMK